ncbi:hydrolase (plasmid) [Sulfitobacter sp. SK012]|uniref:carbon-nitrogen hydrolase family protein n=1 Tax=Sulfitobacter sp. SK012 TaxID=1389005 RepID=UPI000E0B77CF|nr:carbon-nitrogen hydrolase family protein [Sulfitobacter sp. SK012]AXI49360.1 hydrolase [Sulfitobacter sp. SK012]
MKISIAQVDASLAGTDNRFRLLEAQTRQAAIEGANLLVFPELYLSGYNVGEAQHRYAEAQDGNFAQQAQSLAKELGLAIAYGYPERDGDTVYNSVIFIDNHGRILANHRKTVLPPGMEHDWFATGSGFSLFQFEGATLAMIICYECEFPEIVRSVVLGGAEIVIVATAGGKDWEQVPNFVVPSRSYENGVFMVYANYCGAENGHGFCGLSCIVDPFGTDLARAGKAEDVISADLDLGLIAKARSQVPFLRDFREALFNPS